MTHRVIQVDSKVTSKQKADALQQKVIDKLNSENYDLHNQEVNDGSDTNGNATLSIKTDHNNDTQANNFYDWLWSMAQTNQAVYDTNEIASTEGFKQFRIQIHDCKHLESKTERESDLHEKIVNSYPDLNKQDVKDMFSTHDFEGTDFEKACEIGNANKFDLR